MKKLLLLFVVFQCMVVFSQDMNNIRSRECFNYHWKFKRFGKHPAIPGKFVVEPKGLELPLYKDTKWRNLDLPHDWGIEGPFRDDLDNSTGLLPWKGIGWYRKEFKISKSDKGRNIYVDFDGAMANARIWLNGHLVGEWPYGYTSFRLNLTPYIKYGSKNIIAVRLDTENFDSRWYPGAGIYRNVWLVKTNLLHLDHWGIYLTTPEITTSNALVNLQLNLVNDGRTVSKVTVQTNIMNPQNDLIAKSKKITASIPAMTSHKFRLGLKVKEPKLWDIENPVLYKAIVKVFSDEQLIDIKEFNFGIRSLEFDAFKGFLLNGKRVEIKGVCNHHDLGPLGAAFNTRAAERQLEILKEMGCNSIRTSHNPPAPELLDLCDKMGFLVQVEAFDAWQRGKKKKDYNLHFAAWHVEDLTAMIHRDRNHPSVFMWSIGNEVPDQGNPQLAMALANIVHLEDPTRPVTAGCNKGIAGFNGFQKALDVFGYNYNHRSYEKFFNDSTKNNLPFIASETSSCLSSRGEYYFPVKNGSANKNLPGKGIFQMSSYDQQYPGWGVTPDSQFVKNVENPRNIGEYVWTGFDYIGEPTPYNSDITNLMNYKNPARRERLKKRLEMLGTQEIPSRSSYFGILDLCGFRKDRFYIYQAHWNSDLPMAHILPHWNWPKRLGQNVPVHVYTSGDEAELFLNGKSLGKKKKNVNDYRLQWDDVIYSPGELRVKTWKNGIAWAEDIRQTTDKPVKIKLSADRRMLNSDIDDLSFITVDVVDKDNLLVPKSHNLVKFKIKGPGEIIAVGNGDATCHESFISNKHSVYNGKCLVIIRSLKRSGTIKLLAESQGLKSAGIEILVK